MMGEKTKQAIWKRLMVGAIAFTVAGIAIAGNGVEEIKAIPSGRQMLHAETERQENLQYENMSVVETGTCGVAGDENSVIWTVYDSNADGDAGTSVGDVLVISGAGAMADYTSTSYAPWCTNYRATITNVIVESGVTHVGKNTCNGYSKLVSVHIADEGQMTVGEYAFTNCAALTTAVIGDSVTKISQHAFSNNSSLSNVTFSDNLVSIDINAFVNDVALTSITMPDTLETIGASVFQGCTKLKEVRLNEGLESIGNSVFYSTAVTSVTLPDSLTNIGTSVFNNCNQLENVVLPKNMTSIPQSMFRNCTSLGEIVIPGTVLEIGDSAFYGCSSLTNLELPKGLTTIKNSVFRDCDVMTVVTVPDSVVTIGNYAFYDCDSLVEIQLPANLSKIAMRCFDSCDKLERINIPEKLTAIESSAFADCKSITKIVLPKNVTELGGSIFSGCTNLATVSVLGDYTKLQASIFKGCKSLTNVTLPESITEIGNSAFEGCSSLASINLSDNITSIGSRAFYNCKALTSITIPQGITKIEETVFYGCSALKNVDFNGANITSIGASAFNGCTSLPAIDIPNTVTSLGNSVFSGCSKLTEVKLPSGIKTLPIYAFSKCTSLEKIEIPDSCTIIAGYTFHGCSNLWDVQLSDSLVEIGNETFYNCTSLKSIDLPQSLVEIGQDAFLGCSVLEEITIPESVLTLGNRIFSNCSSLKNVTILSSISSIPQNMFIGCKSLVTIEIPNGVTSIGTSAFSGCEKLMSVYIPSTVQTIGTSAFYKCPTDGKIYFQSTIGYNTYATLTGATAPYQIAYKVTNEQGEETTTTLVEVYADGKQSYTFKEGDLPATTGVWLDKEYAERETILAANGSTLKDIAEDVLLEEEQAFSISEQMDDIEMFYGDTGKQLSVDVQTADDNLTVTYQWQQAEVVDGTMGVYSNIDGATNNTYNLSSTLMPGAYRYRCIIKCGEDIIINSNAADVLVKKLITELRDLTIDNWTYGEDASVPEYTCNAAEGVDVIVEYKMKKEQDDAYVTTVPTDAGEYHVRVRCEETDTYSAAQIVQTFSIEKAVLTPQVLGTAQKIYDGTLTVEDDDLSISLTGVLEADKDSVTVSGTYTYTNANVGNDIEIVVSGIMLTGEKSGNYELSTTKLSTTGTILGKPLTVEMIDAIEDCYFNNQAYTPEVKVRDQGVLLLKGYDYEVTYSDNTAVGLGKVYITGCGNYSEEEITVSFIIKNIEAPEYGFKGRQHETGWFTSDVGVYADGYTVSSDIDGRYVPTYTIATEGINEYTLYFKQNETGYITAAQQIEVKVDWTAPSFDEGYGITIADACFNTLQTAITYDCRLNQSPVMGTISAYDAYQDVTCYYYVDNGNTLLTEEDLDALRESGAFSKAIDHGFELDGDNCYVIYAYAVDALENQSEYICTDGIEIDTTAPVLTNVKNPSKEAETLSDCMASVSFTGSEKGDCYYIVRESNENAPTSIADFANKTDGAWMPLENVGKATLEEKDNRIMLDALQANTSYVLYIIAVDLFDNVSEEITKVAFTTTKTMPQFAEVPTLTGVYGDKVSEMVLSNPTSVTEGVTGTWTLTDENVSDMPVVGTNKTYQVIFTPTGENAYQYESVIKNIVPTVEKAEVAPNLPTEEKIVECTVSEVGEVSLESGWQWKDATTELARNAVTKATAEYVGEDKGNYKKESIEVRITRNACPEEGKLLKNDKQETCKDDGYTGDYCCKECGYVLVAGTVIPKHNNHTWDDGVVTTEPTKTEDGERTFTCSVCEGNRYEVIPEIGAPEIADIVLPTKESLTLTDKRAEISFTGSEKGTYYYIVKSEDADAPVSIEEFAKKQDGVWSALEGVGMDVLEGDSSNSIQIDNLTPHTSYVLYVMAIDKVGNISEEVTRVAFTTTKTMPSFSEAPTLTGVYGMKVSEMMLSNPESTTEGVTGTWTLTDENVSDVPVVGTDKTYQVTFTPTGEHAHQYESVIKHIVPIVEKAEVAPNLPTKEKSVVCSVAKVGDVSIEKGWQWKDAGTELLRDGVTQVTAEYVGADKGNYKQESIVIKITRQACLTKNMITKNAKKETCKDVGYTGDSCCSQCGQLLVKGTVIPKHNKHTWDAGVLTKTPTAVATGEKRYTCKICKTTKVESVAAQGLPAKGGAVTDAGNQAKYIVTAVNGTKNTVEYAGPTNQKTVTVTVPDVIVVNGATYHVTSIAKNAFKNNKSLKKVTIGNYVETIGDNAFYGCTSLTSVKFGKNVTTIGNKAFYNCKKLTSITIPSKVNKIGKQAFYKCSQLKKITIKTTKLSKKNVKSKAFGKIYKKPTIKVPKKKLKSYKSLLKARGVSSKAKIKK